MVFLFAVTLSAGLLPCTSDPPLLHLPMSPHMLLLSGTPGICEQGGAGMEEPGT